MSDTSSPHTSSSSPPSSSSSSSSSSAVVQADTAASPRATLKRAVSPSPVSPSSSTVDVALHPSDAQDTDQIAETGPRKFPRANLLSSSPRAQGASSSPSSGTANPSSSPSPSSSSPSSPPLTSSPPFPLSPLLPLPPTTLPLELWVEVATHLGKGDLLRTLQVSSDWITNLHPLTWKTMGHRQWRHPRCSFVLNPRAEHDEAFSRLRCRVEEVEWSNADTQAVGYERLVPIIRSMPNLKRLSLTTTESQQDQNGAFISLLQDENKLTKLRSLDLDLQRFEGQDRIPIRDLFSRLETLYELGINGPWYSGATSAELEQVRQGRPWRLQSLKTPRTDLSLLSVCPELRRLELTAMPSQTEESALAPILACTKLEELCFTGRTAFNIADWGRVLFRLHALITLSITLGHPSDFRRLRPLRYDHFAPSLKKLVVDLDRGMSGGAQPTLSLEDHTMLASILFARDALTAFVLRGFDLEHRYLRTTFEMLGKNTFHRLEELRLEISVPQPDDVRRQREIWQNIYGLLANLRIVHTLTLRCRDLDKTPESGIHLLGRATHLRHLSLMDPGRQAWTSLEVANLMNTVSTLEALDLRPLTARNHSQVNSWLVASGKRQLCF